MLKELIRKNVLKLFPELAAGLHLPLLAVVTGIADPPANGEICDEFTPKYAVDCRLLKPDFTIDDAMPLMRDVPVTLPGAAPDRGLAMLPQPGTIVEIAFAFGLQTHPYIRAVLPHFRKLPVIDDKTMRWQQTANSWIEVDGPGNWKHYTDQNVESEVDQNVKLAVHRNVTVDVDLNIDTTAGQSITRTAQQKITDSALVEYSATAPKIWLGSVGDNFLQIVADYMQTVNAALTTLATHTHETPAGMSDKPKQEKSIAGSAEEVAAEKARTEAIKK